MASKIYPGNCKQCNNDFIGRKNQIFCSSACALEARTKLPFTIDRLWEMYWREKMSTAEIAYKVKEITGQSITPEAIQQRLKRAGINLRNDSQRSTLYYQKFPDRRHWIEKGHEASRHFPHAPSKEAQKAAIKASRLKAKKQREIRACGNPLCNIKISLTPRFQNDGKLHYCSNSCRNIDSKRIRQLKREQQEIDNLRSLFQNL